MGDAQLISGLDGERRQQVATGLWRAWWEEGGRAAVLTGFSGLGKTQQVVRPLMARAINQGRTTVLIDVPDSPMDLDQQLRALLVEELDRGGATALAEAAGRQSSFSGALLELLRDHGALVVIDEFQRLLHVTHGRPSEPLAASLQKIARRAADKGCLWLVSSRRIDSFWTEPFYRAELEAPSDLDDLQRIVLTNIGTADAEQRFPNDRRLEIVWRLGKNPRALRFLGNLLSHGRLDDLLGPPGDMPKAPVDPQFAEQVERELLEKAAKGLSNAAGTLLRELTVLREPAQWELVEAIGRHLGDVRALSRDLIARYLLDVGPRGYSLHPLVREVEGPSLRRDDEAWQAAHRSAGTWYAQLLNAADRTLDVKLALHLAGARYHLTEAQASNELQEAVRGVHIYIEHNYGWSARNPTSDAERDAQISLLDLYLTEPGAPGVEFHFAKLLKERASQADLPKALPHAQRATIGTDFNHAWVLWIQLVREVEGLERGVEAARKAIECVEPRKGLYAIYQLLGACLGHLGRTEEAVDVLLKGVELTLATGREGRLVEGALALAAAEFSNGLLQKILTSTIVQQSVSVGPPAQLGEVLLLEHNGDWRGAAEKAGCAREFSPRYLHLALHEALCWLGAGEPENAQSALDRHAVHWRYKARQATTWFAALVALQQGNTPRASEFLTTYIDASAPATEADIRAVLLWEWDHRVATIGEANPALEFPILPPAVTGLKSNFLRPQYGPPVLPQHQRQHDPPTACEGNLVTTSSRQSSEGASRASTENTEIGEGRADPVNVDNVIAPPIPARMSASTSSKTLLLFVHGLGGKATSTWGRFPEFLRADREMEERFTIGYYSYPTSLFRLPFSSRVPKIQELAAGLRTQIKYEEFERFDLVCHSLGGLIARHYLIEEVKADRPLRVERLALFAVPNNGAGLASVGQFVSWRHNQIKQLCRNADLIELLNEDWVRFRQSKAGTTLKMKFIVGTQDKVVDRFSVAGYWGNPDVETIVGRGHINLVKPDRADDLVVKVLRNFLLA